MLNINTLYKVLTHGIRNSYASFSYALLEYFLYTVLKHGRFLYMVLKHGYVLYMVVTNMLYTVLNPLLLDNV